MSSEPVDVDRENSEWWEFRCMVLMLLSIAVSLISAAIALLAKALMEPSPLATPLAIAALGMSVYMIGIAFLELAKMGWFDTLKQAVTSRFGGETA